MKYKYNGQWLTIPTGGGGGLPDPSAADKMLISNDSLEWEEIDKEDVGTPTWTGTQADYDAAESSIADGTIVNITDDDGNMVGARTTEIYSTDEIVVGRWIDGKPIYRKVIITTLPSSRNSLKTENHNIENIEQIIRIDGYINSLSPLCFYLSSTDGVYVGVTTTLIKSFVLTNDLLNKTANVIIEYTKTTD